MKQGPSTPRVATRMSEDRAKADSQLDSGTPNTVRRFFRVADKMLAQGKGKETHPKRALSVPHHERTTERSYSAEGFPKGGDNPERGGGVQ